MMFVGVVVLLSMLSFSQALHVPVEQAAVVDSKGLLLVQEG